MKRGQAAFEYMILVGVLLVILIPLFNYVSYNTTQNVRVEKLEDAVRTLGKTADSVYALGPGNRDFVKIELPGGVNETIIENNQILIKVSLFGGISDFYYDTIGPINGTLPTERGSYTIKLEMMDDGVVYIERS